MIQVVGLLKQTLWRHFSTNWYKIGIPGKLTTRHRSLYMNCRPQYKNNIKIVIIRLISNLYIAFSLFYLISKDRQSFLRTLLVSMHMFISWLIIEKTPYMRVNKNTLLESALNIYWTKLKITSDRTWCPPALEDLVISKINR